MGTHIFSGAEILLPRRGDEARWAVIACDQFTSEMTYWKEVEALVGEAPSAYHYILPEAYLGTEAETRHSADIARHMASFDPGTMRSFTGMVYVERTLPDGGVRRGLVGKMDLEAYRYEKNAASPIRATEETVLERIPPRCRVRAEAACELPHILILMEEMAVWERLTAMRETLPLLYDFDLMLGGGHIRGWGVDGAALAEIDDMLGAYESARAGGVVYAMGDGNHSLAAAKAHFENLKEKLGVEAALSHPARYALCEVTGLAENSLVFEPIYRLLTHCDPAEVRQALSGCLAAGVGAQTITMLDRSGETTAHFSAPVHALTVGTLQNVLDAYLSAHPAAKCDYIHGEDALRRLAQEEGCVGFLFRGMKKEELFPYVAAHGALPRKTFSMGEARSKRYYLEARALQK